MSLWIRDRFKDSLLTSVRIPGIGPGPPTWQAGILPLNYIRNLIFIFSSTSKQGKLAREQANPNKHLLFEVCTGKADSANTVMAYSGSVFKMGISVLLF